MQNTIKKCLSVLLACLMIMSIATVAFAENGTLTAGTATGKAGEDVVIPVTLNAEGVTSGVFKIRYDANVLTYKSANTATFDASSTVDGATTGTVKFAFANESSAVAANTALITVTFTVKDGAEVGASTVSAELEAADAEHHLKADGFFDANGNEVAVSITAGSVTVEEAAVEIKYGDVDNNGKVNIRDVQALVKYLAGKLTADNINLSAADTDARNHSINIRDVQALVKFLAGKEGYTVLPYVG